MQPQYPIIESDLSIQSLRATSVQQFILEDHEAAVDNGDEVDVAVVVEVGRGDELEVVLHHTKEPIEVSATRSHATSAPECRTASEGPIMGFVLQWEGCTGTHFGLYLSKKVTVRRQELVLGGSLHTKQQRMFLKDSI